MQGNRIKFAVISLHISAILSLLVALAVAYRYLGDSTQFWRLCDANGVIAPDALAARDLIAIPGGERP